MAIAPLPEMPEMPEMPGAYGTYGWPGASGTRGPKGVPCGPPVAASRRAVLHVVPARPPARSAGPRGRPVVARRTARDSGGASRPATTQVRRDVTARIASRSAARRRRRTALLSSTVGAVVVALALPVTVLGGAPVAAPGSGAARAPGAAVYVVRQGDTLWSIASRLDGTGDPRTLAEAIARETGSSTVVPGERIVLP